MSDASFDIPKRLIDSNFGVHRLIGAKARKCVLALALAALLPGIVAAHPGADAAPTPPWQAASIWPDRVTLTFEADPARSLAVSWRTDATVANTLAEIALATADARFDLTSRSVTAQTEPLDLQALKRDGETLPLTDNMGLAPVRFHSVRFDDLQPDTLYAYRVRGGDGAWSEWFHARTAAESGPVRFIYMGDAQNDILSHWSRTVRAAFQAAPDADFILHAGDLVNKGSRESCRG